MLTSFSNGFFAVTRFFHGIATGGQGGSDHFPQAWFVIHDQDADSFHPLRRCHGIALFLVACMTR
jgi:hypothetical protein